MRTYGDNIKISIYNSPSMTFSPLLNIYIHNGSLTDKLLYPPQLFTGASSAVCIPLYYSLTHFLIVHNQPQQYQFVLLYSVTFAQVGLPIQLSGSSAVLLLHPILILHPLLAIIDIIHVSRIGCTCVGLSQQYGSSHERIDPTIWVDFSHYRVRYVMRAHQVCPQANVF